MQNYSYTARDSDGKLVRGAMMAGSEIDLANKVANLGCFLVRCKVITESSGRTIGAGYASLKSKEVLDLTIQLSTLLDAGMSLVVALKELSRDEQKEGLKKILDDIRYKVEGGSSFKEALLSHPRSFSNLYIAIVGAGESTGKLASCLNDLAILLDWQLELRGKIKEAATYPIIIFVVMVGVVTLLVVKVIPVFEPIFKDLGANLPLPTQIVLAVSHFVRSFWYLILMAAALLAFGYKLYYATANGRYVLDSLKLKLPVFGVLLRKVALSRFCHTLTLSLRSGVNLLTALDMARDVTDNSRLEKAVTKAKELVNVGEKLAHSLEVSGEFSPLVIRMIAVGEQSGAITQTLDKVNQFYDREVPATIRRIFAIFEPVMLIFMGVVVGGIALSIFLPIFQMSQLIGG